MGGGVWLRELQSSIGATASTDVTQLTNVMQMPSREEVDEAIHGLRSSLQRTNSGASGEVLVPELGMMTTVGARMLPYLPQGVQHRFVAQALNLIDNNPEVQDAVASLAQDRRVLEAICQNQGVQSLMRRRRVPQIENANDAYVDEIVDEMEIRHMKGLDPLNVFIRNITSGIHNILQDISSFVLSLFGKNCQPGNPMMGEAIEKEQFEGEAQSIIPTLIVLTILIICIVAFKRPLF